ncbi:MAG: hypothetical protein R6V75_02875 [Bacteroidales bacterium]
MKTTESGNYFALNPAGGMVLLLGLIAILAIPPSGLFIGEYLLFKELVQVGNWWVLALTLLLLCFVMYAMATRFMHILFSHPTEPPEGFTPGVVKPWETVIQFAFLALVFLLCFHQPEFLEKMIEVIVG